jgi:uncharacterized protein (TIGR02679 family)
VIPPYLRSPHLAALWKETHRRLSTGVQVTAIRLRNLSEDERHALAELLGADRLPAAECSIKLAAVREAIRPHTLEVALTELVGPIENAALQRDRYTAERDALWSWLESHPLLIDRPVLRVWAARLRAEPPIGVYSEKRELIGRALEVLRSLPVERLPLPVLAQRTLGDPHALDLGRLPGLVLRAIALETGVPEPTNAEQRRRTWESAGVICDELSSTVLAAGLAPEGDSLLACMLRAARSEGQAVPVTLAQLRKAPDRFAPKGTVISVVENPSIMQAALDRFGNTIPPLVCVSGRPHIAARILLRSLTETGAQLRYHGDFDPAGISIAADMIANLGARPWRMGAEDYLAGLRQGPLLDPAAVPETPWDDHLAEAMRREGTAVYEEAVVGALIYDLGHQRSHQEGHDEHPLVRPKLGRTTCPD